METIIEKTLKNVNTADVCVKPVGPRVVFKQYDTNPYLAPKISEEGVIFDVPGINRYKSNETGEMTENQEVIVCAKVISVGDACKWVKEGDDIFLCKTFATPLPFRGLHYMVTDENNVICVINKA